MSFYNGAAQYMDPRLKVPGKLDKRHLDFYRQSQFPESSDKTTVKIVSFLKSSILCCFYFYSIFQGIYDKFGGTR
jgi:hypothetical protein